MFAVFGKSKKKEFENSFNKLGVKIKDEERVAEILKENGYNDIYKPRHKNN